MLVHSSFFKYKFICALKIVRENSSKKKTFDDISIGEVFYYQYCAFVTGLTQKENINADNIRTAQ